MSPERMIQEGMKVKNFLNDDTIKSALATIAARYYSEFRKADSSEKRVTAWAKANALEDFLTELQVIQDQGEHATLRSAKGAPKPKE